jgi:hypothetical protein
MNRFPIAILTLAIGLVVPCASMAQAPAAFDQIKGLSFEQAREQALAYVKQVKKDDAAALKKAEELWNPVVERPLLERVVDTFTLVDVDAADLIQSVRNPESPAPTEVPDLLRDASRPAFVRDHLGLYFAKQLSLRKVHEQMLETVKLLGSPEQLADPATYYFVKAVADHKLQNKDAALRSIQRLLNSVENVPERYQVLANLMKMEMEGWKGEDLGYIARVMEDVARRLELARASKPTQIKEEEVIDKLDQLIKKMEEEQNKQKQPGPGGGSGPATNRPSNPADKPYTGGPRGQGRTDKELQRVMELWGKLPEKDKARALEQIKRQFPPQYQQIIDEFAKLNSSHR